MMWFGVRTREALPRALIFLLLIGPFARAHAQGDPRQYDLPVGELATVLGEFANQSQVKVTIPSELVRGKTSHAVSGRYSAADALNELLAGTGLTARMLGPNDFAISVIGQAEKGGGLGEITVFGRRYQSASTGTKTDTPLMETPLTIQVIPAQLLQDQQALTLDQALVNVSGVQSGGGEGFSEQIYLRGFVTTTTFRDGFRLDFTNSTDIGTTSLANVDRIEVLKGPSAILYGRVEPGGMVNVVTKEPLDTAQAVLQVLGGSWNHYRVAGDFTGPINSDGTLLYRLNASYDTQDSWRHNVNSENPFIAPVLEWKIDPDTQAILKAQLERQLYHADVGQIAAIDPANNELVFPGRDVNFLDNPTALDKESFELSFVHKFSDSWKFTNRYLYNDVRNPEGNTYIDYYPDYFFQEGPDWMVNRSPVLFVSKNRISAALLELTGHFDTLGVKHTLLVGGDFYHTDAYFSAEASSGSSNTSIYSPTYPCCIPVNNAFYSQSEGFPNAYGAYLQDQLTLPWNLFLLVGWRYDRVVESSYELASVAFGGTGENVQQPTTDDHKVTPRYGLLWRPESWLSLYANYVENFGANNGFNYRGEALAPEGAIQDEIGAKTEFYGGKLTGSLAAYDLTKNNVAVSDPAHVGYSIPIGQIRSKGIELDIQGEVLPGWNVVLNYAYDQVIVTQGGPLGTAAGYKTGNYLANDPEHLGHLWTSYAFRGVLPGFKAGAGITWRGPALDPTNVYRCPAYSYVDIFAAYDFELGKSNATLQLNVNNLFNRFYWNFDTNFTVPGQYAYFTYGAERNATLSLRVKF